MHTKKNQKYGTIIIILIFYLVFIKYAHFM